MASWEWRRSVTNAAILVELGDDHGLTQDQCLRGTDVDPRLLKTPGGEITAAQELAIVGNLVTLLDDPPGLGVEAGTRTHLTTHGVLALAVLSSPTMRQAIDVAMRYFSLMTSFARAWHIYRDDEILLYGDDRDLPGELRAFLAERDVSALLTNWFMVFGVPPPVVRVEIAGGLRPRLAPLFDSFEIPSSESAELQLAVFDATGIDEPMPQASPLTAQLFEEQCDDLLQRRGLRQGVAGTVREMLMHRMNSRLSQEDVAAGLHMSLRTMRRRLAEEGTSYRQLCAETFGTLAEELLATGLTVEDVAYRMGYSGAPSFSNAFKQWRGVSPGRFARSTVDRYRQSVPR
ncbi:AraC family transcriptional regulator ligand-binding domain-containing protein [Nocardia suismassiliense]|uniref:AraC family transcriptional regulator ligand-binding domain-containing protein n=1 Tax=Nocardia suismassiliense TaxID=2077092 RepID=A0ABW6QPZ9_9NOCA|nr:AraC family transcriptional regulator [Nocardia sp. XZ_19_369]